LLSFAFSSQPFGKKLFSPSHSFSIFPMLPILPHLHAFITIILTLMGMCQLAPCLDTASFFVDAQVILERTEADDGPGLVRRFIGRLRIPADKLPALEVDVGLQVLPPRADRSGFERQDQHHPVHRTSFRGRLGGGGRSPLL